MANSDWWSKKLQQQDSRPSVPPVAPPQRIEWTPGQQIQNPQVQYDPNRDQLTVSKAVSARNSQYCPGCGSGNYMAPMGTQKMRCYDCGYPVVQSGSGGGLPSDSSGPATPARQAHKGNNWNPNVIVDRIG